MLCSLNQLIHLTGFYCLLYMQGTVLSTGDDSGGRDQSNSLPNWNLYYKSVCIVPPPACCISLFVIFGYSMIV